MSLIGRVADRMLGLVVPQSTAGAIGTFEHVRACYGGGCQPHPDTGECGVWEQACVNGSCAPCYMKFGCAPCG
ncbi:hypothetical protein [Pseudonocardia sp. TRM90224]|uniref:hypothetical protein n=1 Tax=Pseudonocardia sp. TRM90224 TaxID=2812678 RepID=UPI001E3AEE71|nr:hypothetical protein [Pseudonocardia sp. TRM90224]